MSDIIEIIGDSRLSLGRAHRDTVNPTLHSDIAAWTEGMTVPNDGSVRHESGATGSTCRDTERFFQETIDAYCNDAEKYFEQHGAAAWYVSDEPVGLVKRQWNELLLATQSVPESEGYQLVRGCIYQVDRSVISESDSWVRYDGMMGVHPVRTVDETNLVSSRPGGTGLEDLLGAAHDMARDLDDYKA